MYNPVFVYMFVEGNATRKTNMLHMYMYMCKYQYMYMYATLEVEISSASLSYWVQVKRKVSKAIDSKPD